MEPFYGVTLKVMTRDGNSSVKCVQKPERLDISNRLRKNRCPVVPISSLTVDVIGGPQR